MKKLFVTLACLAVIVLFGTYAYNQNMIKTNSDKENHSEIIVTKTPYQSGQLDQDITNTPIPSKNVPTVTIVPTKTPTKSPSTTQNITTPPTQTKTQKPTITPIPAKPTTAPKSTVNNTTNSSTTKNYANEVMRLVNQQRAKAGLSAFTTNNSLTAAANKRAQEIAISFSHTRPNGSGFSTVLKEYSVSYNAAGENIAYGQRSPKEVVNAWMNSPGHRANILKSKFKKLGIGVYQKNGTYYWTQEFTN